MSAWRSRAGAPSATADAERRRWRSGSDRPIIGNLLASPLKMNVTRRLTILCAACNQRARNAAARRSREPLAVFHS